MRVRIGQLDQRITLQARVKSRDALGTDDYTFANLPSRPVAWARARPLRGKELFAAGEMRGQITTEFTIRYRSDLDEKMRVVWRGKPYDIASPPIDVEGAREWTQLLCITGVRDGR